jgi:hypothetical protein
VPIPPKSVGSSPATRFRETSGPTELTIGAVADGEFLVRDGNTIIGSAGGGGGAVGLSVAHTYGALPDPFSAGAAVLTGAVPALAVRFSA